MERWRWGWGQDFFIFRMEADPMGVFAFFSSSREMGGGDGTRVLRG